MTSQKNYYAMEKTMKTKNINGQQTTTIKESENINGVKKEKITFIDANGKKTEINNNSNNSNINNNNNNNNKIKNF